MACMQCMLGMGRGQPRAAADLGGVTGTRGRQTEALAQPLVGDTAGENLARVASGIHNEKFLNEEALREIANMPDYLEKKKACLRRSALCLFESIDGESRVHPGGGKSQRWAYKRRLQFKHVVRIVSILNVLLTIWEMPRWCKQIERFGPNACSSDNYPSYPIDYLSEMWDAILEILFFTVLLADNLLLVHAQGFRPAMKKPRQRFRLIVLGLNLADMFNAYVLGGWSNYRLAGYFRIVIAVLYDHPVQTSLRLILSMMPALVPILTLCAINLFCFGWLGTLLFPANTEEGQAFFNGLGNAMWSLLVLQTTANFPDVMMPAYKMNRSVFIYFLAFVCIGVFVLVNVVTAVVFNAYSKAKDENTKRRDNVRENARKNAFKLLFMIDGDPDALVTKIVEGKTQMEINVDGSPELAAISKELMKLQFTELALYPDIPNIANVDLDEVMDKLDDDGGGTIDYNEFGMVVEAIKQSVHVKFAPPFLERMIPALRNQDKTGCWRKLKTTVRSQGWEYSVDAILLVSVGLAFAESCSLGLLQSQTKEEALEIQHEAATRHGQGVSLSPTSFAFWNVFISIGFVIEVALKILVNGFPRYWYKLMNRFDFVISMATGAVAALVLLPNGYNNPDTIRMAAMLRVARVLRLLYHVNFNFKAMMNTFVEIVPDGVAITKALLSSMFVFSLVGMQLFGGKITRDKDSSFYAPVAATDYAGADYYANNFNDILSGMVTLFELLVVNNWFEIVDGFSAAEGSQWTAIYFVIWYIFGFCFVMNIVISIILGAFVDVFEVQMIGGQVFSSGKHTGLSFEVVRALDKKYLEEAKALTNDQLDNRADKDDLVKFMEWAAKVPEEDQEALAEIEEEFIKASKD